MSLSVNKSDRGWNCVKEALRVDNMKDIIAGSWSICVQLQQWIISYSKMLSDWWTKNWEGVVEDKYEIFIDQNRF